MRDTLADRRASWNEFLALLTFEDGADKMLARLQTELANDSNALREHLHLAGVIPEVFGHDSTEEKLFAKYSDTVLALAFEAMGCAAEVIVERAGRADVDVYFDDVHLVADAKAFRLSRTAKNQKDFKVQALDEWRQGADAAALVCPLFQYPVNQSQIYEQATRRNVALISYTHLQAILSVAEPLRLRMLNGLLSGPSRRSPDKSAKSYWRTLRESMLQSLAEARGAWDRAVTLERLALEWIVGMEAECLQSSLDRFDELSREQLLAEVVKTHRIEDRLERVRATRLTDIVGF